MRFLHACIILWYLIACARMSITFCGSANLISLRDVPSNLHRDATLVLLLNKQGTEEFAAILKQAQQAQVNAECDLDAFWKRAVQHRGTIVDAFEQLKQAVDSSQCAALVEYDGAVQGIEKALELHVGALQVQVYQIAAHIDGGINLPDLQVDVAHWKPRASLPVFKTAGLRILRDALQAGKCWSFLHPLPNSKFNNAETVDRFDCTLLESMHQFITDAKEDLGRAVFFNHIVSSLPFENQCVATIPVECLVNVDKIATVDSGFAAFLDLGYHAEKNTSITTFSMRTGEKIAKFGFHDSFVPSDLCFVPGTGNLLVAGRWIQQATSTVRCIKEVTLTGDYIRVIYVTKKSYDCIDANANVIVASERNSIDAYHYRTGTVFRRFVSESGIYSVVKLTPDGNCVAFSNEFTQYVTFMALDSGLCVKTYHFPFSRFDRRDIFFLSSGTLVVKVRCPADRREGVVSTDNGSLWNTNSYRVVGI